MVIKKLRIRIKKYLSSPAHVRTVSLVILLVIVLAIPLTVYVVGLQQDIRQEAAADSTFRSIDTNKCGSIVSQPAAGVTTGTIVWKAPKKLATGWETVKADGTSFSQAQMKESYVGEVRNGEAIGADGRAAVWDTTVVSETHINCNTFINITADGDCTVEFVDAIGSTDHPVGPEGMVSLRFTVDTNRTGGFCRKLINVETSVGTSPTATPTPTLGGPTATPTPTLIPAPSATPTVSLTLTPTRGATVTPTLPATPTRFFVSVSLPGVGKNGNVLPNNASRTLLFQLFTAANQQVGSDLKEDVFFDASSGVFKGEVNAGTIVPSGSYTIKVKFDQSLKKAASNSAVTAGTTNTVPVLLLVTGDVNNDNKLDMLDYNILVSCFGAKINSEGCGNKKVDADLNDDGMLDGTDYNLFIRGLKIAKVGE